MPVRTGQGPVVWRRPRERPRFERPPRPRPARAAKKSRRDESYVRVAWRGRGSNGDGPLCLDIHQQDRCQGTRLDSRSLRAVLERDGYAGGADRATPRSMLRRSMAAASGWQKRSTGFLRACQTIRTSATSSLSRSTATSRSSPSTGTDALSYLRSRPAAMPALEIRSLLSVLATSFRCGLRKTSKSGAEMRARKCKSTESYSARGAATAAGAVATREHGNDARSRVRWGAGEPQRRPRHIPVLVSEMLSALGPRRGETYIDATFGAGGYARAILDAASCRVVALDRDPEAIKAGFCLVEAYVLRLTLIQERFANLAELAEALRLEAVHGVVFDFGVSSSLTSPSAASRSNRTDRSTCACRARGQPRPDVVNSYEEEPLANLIDELGEEPRLARHRAGDREEAERGAVCENARARRPRVGGSTAGARVTPAILRRARSSGPAHARQRRARRDRARPEGRERVIAPEAGSSP